MKLDVQTLRQAWQARNRREQWILCVAALAVPLLLADTLVWNPWRLQMKALNARLAQAEQELRQLGSAQAAIAPQDAAALSQLEALRKRLVRTEQLAADARRQVVSPQQMAATLREVTQPGGASAGASGGTSGGASSGAVNVVALRSLPVTPLAESGAAAGASAHGGASALANPPRLYRHTFELQLEGSYADIARYIEHLEQTAGVLRWNALELDASRHPTVAARLEVFTLSEQPSWIQL